MSWRLPSCHYGLATSGTAPREVSLRGDPASNRLDEVHLQFSKRVSDGNASRHSRNLRQAKAHDRIFTGSFADQTLHFRFLVRVTSRNGLTAFSYAFRS